MFIWWWWGGGGPGRPGAPCFGARVLGGGGRRADRECQLKFGNSNTHCARRAPSRPGWLSVGRGAPGARPARDLRFRDGLRSSARRPARARANTSTPQRRRLFSQPCCAATVNSRHVRRFRRCSAVERPARTLCGAARRPDARAAAAPRPAGRRLHLRGSSPSSISAGEREREREREREVSHSEEEEREPRVMYKNGPQGAAKEGGMCANERELAAATKEQRIRTGARPARQRANKKGGGRGDA